MADEERERRGAGSDEPGDGDGGAGDDAARNGRPKRRFGGPQWGSVARSALLGIVALLMLWLVLHVHLPSIDEMHRLLDRWGGAAWAVFVLLYAVVAITPIPVTVMATAGGLLFGVVEGSALSVVGALLGSWAAYWLARLLGKETVRRMLGHHGAAVEEHLHDTGMKAVYLLRLMPGLPYWPVNYGSGAFGVSQRDFLLASCLATIPGQVSLVAIGAFIANPGVGAAAVVGVAWAVVGVMTFFAWRDWRRATRH